MSPIALDLKMAQREIDLARDAFADATSKRALADAIDHALAASRWLDQLLDRYGALETATEQRRQQTKTRRADATATTRARAAAARRAR